MHIVRVNFIQTLSLIFNLYFPCRPLSAGSLVPKMSTPQTSFQHIRLIEDSSNILITVKQLFDNDGFCSFSYFVE